MITLIKIINNKIVMYISYICLNLQLITSLLLINMNTNNNNNNSNIFYSRFNKFHPLLFKKVLIATPHHVLCTIENDFLQTYR